MGHMAQRVRAPSAVRPSIISSAVAKSSSHVVDGRLPTWAVYRTWNAGSAYGVQLHACTVTLASEVTLVVQ